MAQQQRTGVLSRRQLLGGVASLAGVALLAACGGGSPTATTKPAAAGGGAASTAPAASGSAVPAASGSAAPAASGSAAPASAAAVSAAPTKDLTIVSGKFNVWFSANWNIVTDEAVGNTFVEWGKKNNIQVEWQSIPGSPLILQKESAALAAGQPPEITNSNQVYLV